MKRVVLNFLVSVLIMSCGPHSGRPGFVPAPDEMALVLADVYEVEAAVTQSGRRISREEEKYLGYYKSVLDKHGMTKVELDSAVAWYSNHPELFADVYEKVISTLSQRDAILKKKMTEEMEAQKKNPVEQPPIEDYWSGVRKYTLPLEAQDSSHVFFPYVQYVDSLSSGVMNLMANVTFIKGNELDSARMVMVMCYADSTRDTLRTVINKSFRKHIESVTSNIRDDNYLLSVEGYLFEHDSTKVANVEIDDVKLTLIPRISPVEIAK